MSKGKNTDSDNEHTDIPTDFESALGRITERPEKLLHETDEASDAHYRQLDEFKERSAKTEPLVDERSNRHAECERYLAESRKWHAESRKWHEISDKYLAESRKWHEIIDKQLAENRKQMIEDGIDFEFLTKRRAMPAIERIMEEEFDAECWKRLVDSRLHEIGRLEVDAWGGARDGVKTVYLVMIRDKAKKRHIQEMHDLVQRFRCFYPHLNNHRIYTMIAAVEIKEKLRQKIWDAGIYLIEEADGVFELAAQPKDFLPDGNSVIDEIQVRVPHLYTVPGGKVEEEQVSHD